MSPVASPAHPLTPVRPWRGGGRVGAALGVALCAALCAAGLVATTPAWAQAPAPGQTASHQSAGSPVRVQVPSLDRTGGEPVQQPGFWFPAGPLDEGSPRPALVLLHGCGGPYERSGGQLSERMVEYAAWLNARGVHALVVDSLTPRGERELCTQRTGSRRVTQTQRRRDALGALQWLAAQPGVDARRLGLLGWSNGGSAVLAATNLQHPEVRRAPVAPSLAVAFYPGCASDLRAGYRPVAPLLMQVGEDDDWTPAEPCRQLAAQASEITFHAYPGAVHGFDGTAPVRTRRDVPNGLRPGQGVRVGGQPEAREASRQRLADFLSQAWSTRP